VRPTAVRRRSLFRPFCISRGCVTLPSYSRQPSRFCRRRRCDFLNSLRRVARAAVRPRSSPRGKARRPCCGQRPLRQSAEPAAPQGDARRVGAPIILTAASPDLMQVLNSLQSHGGRFFFVTSR
jgi:hypothetical protein